MMDTDEKIKIADRIYKKLVNVQRNEWNRWMNYFEHNGWAKALTMARILSQSSMLRLMPQKNYKRIYDILSIESEKMKKMGVTEVMEIFGYISWKLANPIGFGMWKDEAKSQRRISHRY